MNVDPADTPAVQIPIANQADNLFVRDEASVEHPFVCREQLPAPSAIAHKKFSIDQLVPNHLIESKKSLQLRCVRNPIGVETYPHGRVHEHHQAALRFADGLRLAEGLSRRLGTSLASGSEPRRVARN
jgi:hypothetical protein